MSDIILLLPRSGILSFLDDEARGQLARYGTTVSTKPGEVLIREGEVNTHLYIVLGGSFDITIRAQGNDIPLGSVGKGECFGEVAIFDPDRASATVTGVGAGELWSIDAENFQAFLFDCPHAGCAAILGVNIILSRRLKHANDVIRFNEIVPGFLSVRAQKRKPGETLG